MNVQSKLRMKGKRISPSDIQQIVPPGSNAFLQQGASEPRLLHSALLGAASRVEIRVLTAPVAGLNECPFASEDCALRQKPVVFIGAPSLAQGISEGRVDYVPSHWSQIVPSILRRFPPDLAVIQVSPPDANGFCNLGVSSSLEFELLDSSRVVIAEVNRTIPVVAGDTRVHVDRIDFFAEIEGELLTSRPSAVGDVELAISRNVCRLVPARSAVQVGIGSVPDAVVTALAEEGKIERFHSGILTDSMMSAAAAWKEPGSVTAGMIVGSKALYSKVGHSSQVVLRSYAHTHSQEFLASIDRFVAVNSALEVDLLGQVNAECLGGRQIGGVGGQLDFFRGAHASRGGMAIIAMPSTSGGRSRIVPRLGPASVVTTGRVDVDYLITEWGIAELRDRTIAERATALVEVAAPEFRKDLRGSITNLLQ